MFRWKLAPDDYKMVMQEIADVWSGEVSLGDNADIMAWILVWIPCVGPAEIRY